MMDSTTPTNDHRIVVSPRRACHMLDCGSTRLYQLLAAGELESFLDGRSRKITVASIRRYVERRVSTATLPNRRAQAPQSEVEAAAAVMGGGRERRLDRQRHYSCRSANAPAAQSRSARPRAVAPFTADARPSTDNGRVRGA